MKKLSGSTAIRHDAVGMWSLQLVLVVAVAALAFGAKVSATPAANSLPAGPDFNNAIRPILSENCYKSMGPMKPSGKQIYGLIFETRHYVQPVRQKQHRARNGGQKSG